MIGSSRWLLLFWLVGVIALGLVFRQSFENRSTCRLGTRDFASFEIPFAMYCSCLQYGCYHVLWFLFNFFSSARWKNNFAGHTARRYKRIQPDDWSGKKIFHVMHHVTHHNYLGHSIFAVFRPHWERIFRLPSSRKKRLTCAALIEQSPCAIVRRCERSWICDLCRSSFVFDFIKHENCTVVFNSA